MPRTTFVLLFLLLIYPFRGISQNAAGYSFSNVKIGGGGFVTGIITCPTEKNLIYARTDVGGAYRWNETGQKWVPLLDWVNRSQVGYMGVESVAIDPQSPNKVYMLVGTSYFNNGNTAILRSSDYGDNFSITDVSSQFKAHGNGMGRQNGERLAVDPNNGNIIFCGTRRNGLFVSTDLGVSFAQNTAFPVTTTTNDNGICCVVFDKSSSASGSTTQRIFVGVSRTGNGNLYRTDDGGNTWNLVASAITTHMPQRMLISNEFLYVTYADAEGPWNPTDGYVYKYDITNKIWTNITPPKSGGSLPFAGITVDYNNSDIIMVSTINKWTAQSWLTGKSTVYGDKIFRSINGGSSWTELFSTSKMNLNASNLWAFPPSLHWVGDIQMDPFNSDRVWAISGNGIFMTNNISNVATGLSNWYFQCDGLEETVALGITSLTDGPVVSVIGDYDGFVHTDVTATPARHYPNIGSSLGVDFAQNKPSFVVRSGGSSETDLIFYSNNKGTSWTKFNAKPSTTSARGYVAVSADGSKVIWTPDNYITSSSSFTSPTNMYFTTNYGTSWTAVTSIALNGRPVADRVNNSLLYMLSGSTLYVLTFKDTNYTYITKSIGATGSNLIRPVSNREGEVWIACYSSGLKKYTVSTNTVSSVSNVTACEGVGFGKAATGKTFPTVYIWGTVDNVEGIYRSDDEGASWSRINDDAHEFGGLGNGNFIIGDANVYGRIYFSSVGRGILMGKIDSANSIIDISETDNFSGKGQVFSNYLPIESTNYATYYIIDLSGKIIETSNFKGSISVGGSLHAGLYLLQIVEGNKRQVMRILKTD